MTLQNAVDPSPSLAARAKRLASSLARGTARLDQRAKTSPTDDFRDKLTELLIQHRWAIVVPFVLPLSKAYDLYWTARHVYYRNLRNAAAGHDQRVARVVAQIDAWRANGRPGLLHTSRKSWQSVAVRAIEYKKHSKSGIDARQYGSAHALARPEGLDRTGRRGARRSYRGRSDPRLRHRIVRT
jgi:hypothetical protein